MVAEKAPAGTQFYNRARYFGQVGGYRSVPFVIYLLQKAFALDYLDSQSRRPRIVDIHVPGEWVR